jgi:hypothetical protein
MVLTIGLLGRAQLVSPVWFGHSFPDFGAALRALVDEINLRHAPMGFNIANVHSETYAVGADDWGGLNFVMLDVGWHVGSPSH